MSAYSRRKVDEIGIPFNKQIGPCYSGPKMLNALYIMNKWCDTNSAQKPRTKALNPPFQFEDYLNKCKLGTADQSRTENKLHKNILLGLRVSHFLTVDKDMLIMRVFALVVIYTYMLLSKIKLTTTHDIWYSKYDPWITYLIIARLNFKLLHVESKVWSKWWFILV